MAFVWQWHWFFTTFHRRFCVLAGLLQCCQLQNALSSDNANANASYANASYANANGSNAMLMAPTPN
jgi:hypothetical protein